MKPQTFVVIGALAAVVALATPVSADVTATASAGASATAAGASVSCSGSATAHVDTTDPTQSTAAPSGPACSGLP